MQNSLNRESDNGKPKLFLAVFIFTALIIPLSARAEFSCSVKTSCSAGETDVFHMSSLENAHAELANQSHYQYKVCCSGAKGGMITTCSGSSQILLRLSYASNAHAEKSTLSNYQNAVCLGANEGQIICDYVNSPSACTVLGSYYRCLATISSDTNAHVSDCDGTNDYNIKVCCGYRDITPPVTTINPSGSSWTGQDMQFSLSCSDVGGLCQSTYYKIINESESCGTSGFSLGASGTIACASGFVCTRKVCYYSSDDSGNQEQPAKISSIFRIDKKAPTTTDNSDDYWHGSNVQITLACQDAESGCNRTYYCIYNEGETPCTPSIQGNIINASCQQGVCRKIIRYYSTDSSNNQESPHNSKTIKIDTSLPTCTMTPLNEYTTSASIRLFWTAVTQGGPINNVTIEKREASTWEAVQAFTAASGSYDFSSQNGHTYYFRCLATNMLGQGSYSAEIKTTVDTGQPSASIAASNLVNTTSFNVNWSGNDAETGVANYTLYYKIGPGTYSIWKVFEPPETSAKFGEGGQPIIAQNNNTYTFKVKVTDNAGNSMESNEASVFVDTGKPTCTIQDMPTYQSSSDFTVSWSGADAESGIKEYTLEQRVGGFWIQVYKGSQTSMAMTNAQDGQYAFRCRATDNANNTGSLSAEKSTTVDVNPPAADINFSSSVYVNESLAITTTVTDAIRVGNVTLYYQNAVVPVTATQIVNSSSWDLTWTLSNLVTTGTNTFTISVQDAAGNSYNYTRQFLVAYCIPGDIIQGCQCGTGTKTCRNDGTWSNCTGITKYPAPEVCDGIDNDCNGIVDDVNGGNSIQSTQCQCYGSSLLAATSEVCNGIDDDCDGQIDDNANCCTNGDTRQCGTVLDLGICHPGTSTCMNGTWSSCQNAVAPQSKICTNGLDNDCNGVIDSQEPACLSPDSAAHCQNGMQDADETDVDCGGNDCSPCQAPVNNTISPHCQNGMQDADETGVDCGGNDCAACFQWGWLWLTAGGVVILLILAFVWLHFRKQGKELTWEALKEKWTPSG